MPGLLFWGTTAEAGLLGKPSLRAWLKEAGELP